MHWFWLNICTHLHLLFLKLDGFYLVCLEMEFDLEETIYFMPNQRHKSDVTLTSVPSKRKKIADWEVKCHAVEEIPQSSNEPIKVVPSPWPKGVNSSHFRCEHENYYLPNFRFILTRGYHNMGILRFLVTPIRAKAIVQASTNDIERKREKFGGLHLEGKLSPLCLSLSSQACLTLVYHFVSLPARLWLYRLSLLSRVVAKHWSWRLSQKIRRRKFITTRRRFLLWSNLLKLWRLELASKRWKLINYGLFWPEHQKRLWSGIRPLWSTLRI